jgi:hypothetical protein
MLAGRTRLVVQPRSSEGVENISFTTSRLWPASIGVALSVHTTHPNIAVVELSVIEEPGSKDIKRKIVRKR